MAAKINLPEPHIVIIEVFSLMGSDVNLSIGKVCYFINQIVHSASITVILCTIYRIPRGIRTLVSGVKVRLPNH